MYRTECPKCGAEALEVVSGSFTACGMLLCNDGFSTMDAKRFDTENEIVRCDNCGATFDLGNLDLDGPVSGGSVSSREDRLRAAEKVCEAVRPRVSRRCMECCHCCADRETCSDKLLHDAFCEWEKTRGAERTSTNEPTPNLTLRHLQAEQRVWVEQNFDTHNPLNSFLGVVEEVGELAHALLKRREGVRGTAEEHAAKARDAVGDIVLFLVDFCSESGWDPQEILEETWAQVKRRDWPRDPVSARPEGTSRA